MPNLSPIVVGGFVAVLSLSLLAPSRVRATAPGALTLSLGLSTYRPALKEVRDQLQGAGGGKLVLRDDYWGERLYFSAGFAGHPRDLNTPSSIREFSYCRYRARSASQDYLVEIEKFTGALVRPFKAKSQSRLQYYWGGGLDLIRMKREGAVQERGRPPVTQKDWLGGLCSFVGVEYFLSGRLSLNTRFIYDFVPSSTFNGVEYRLRGKTLAYALAWRW